jgi:hypothetical protein
MEHVVEHSCSIDTFKLKVVKLKYYSTGTVAIFWGNRTTTAILKKIEEDLLINKQLRCWRRGYFRTCACTGTSTEGSAFL